MDTVITTTRLREILDANKELRKEVPTWAFSYSKKTDLFVAGKDFPKNSFYVHVDDGLMLRVDGQNQIHGFAIENASYFVQRNPELALPLSIAMHPIRSFFITIPALLLTFQVGKGMAKMRALLSMFDFVASRASFV